MADRFVKDRVDDVKDKAWAAADTAPGELWLHGGRQTFVDGYLAGYETALADALATRGAGGSDA